MREPNLFMYLYSRLAKDIDDERSTLERENLLTETIAFYLSCDPVALMRFCSHILGRRREIPSKIGTQHRESDGVPDLVVEFKSKRKLFVEHKLGASLNQEQLERYLQTGEYVALVSDRRQAVSPEVLACRRYCRPHDRNYFSWQDVYGLIPASRRGQAHAALRHHVRAFLEFQGFAPSRLPREWRRLFQDREDSSNKKVQRNFGKQLDGVESFLKEQKFDVSGVSHKGLQAARRGTPFLHLVVWPGSVAAISPEQRQFLDREALIVGLVYDSPTPPRHALDLERRFPKPSFRDPLGNHWIQVPPVSLGNMRTRLEFATSLKPFVSSEREIRERLRAGCRAVIETILALSEQAAAIVPTPELSSR